MSPTSFGLLNHLFFIHHQPLTPNPFPSSPSLLSMNQHISTNALHVLCTLQTMSHTSTILPLVYSDPHENMNKNYCTLFKIPPFFCQQNITSDKVKPTKVGLVGEKGWVICTKFRFKPYCSHYTSAHTQEREREGLKSSQGNCDVKNCF